MGHEPRKAIVCDRTHWGRGPWDDELVDAQDYMVSDLPCALRRNEVGAWCGYVGVNHPHSLYGVDKLAVETKSDLAGVLTLSYSGWCLCDDCVRDYFNSVWWFGFDCSGSYCPGSPVYGLNYVYFKAACALTTQLAKWLAAQRAKRLECWLEKATIIYSRGLGVYYYSCSANGGATGVQGAAVTLGECFRAIADADYQARPPGR
jgi:hypothetical protein